MPMKKIEISHEPVELYKILKFEAIAASGGEAKALVASGAVLVNGQVETRKRCQMNSGDVIEVFDEKFELSLAEQISWQKSNRQ